MQGSGDRRLRRFPLISGRHRSVPARRSPRARPLSRGPLVHRGSHPGTAGTATPRSRAAAPNVRAGPASEPGSLSCGGRIISQKGTRSIWIACSRLIHGSGLLGTRSRSSTSCTRPKTSTAPTQLLGGSPISTRQARHREYQQVVDTIIAWGEEILAYHRSRRATNGPIEGINNLHPGPTPSRSRVHQHRQFRSPRSSCNVTPTPTTRTAQIPRFREASTCARA